MSTLRGMAAASRTSTLPQLGCRRAGRGRAAAGTAASWRARCTSRPSTPRRCRSCRTARSHWEGSCRPGRYARSRRGPDSARETRPASSWPASGPSAPAPAPRRTASRRARRERHTPTPPRWDRLAGPGGVGRDVLPGDMQHRVPLPAIEGAAGSLRMAPVGAGHPVPPGVVAAQRHPPGGWWKTTEPATSISGMAPG